MRPVIGADFYGGSLVASLEFIAKVGAVLPNRKVIVSGNVTPVVESLFQDDVLSSFPS
jgi:hypothetical protein